MKTGLRLDSVSKVFGSGDLGVAAVRSATAAVEPGQLVLIMGPSGSGKTTLLSICGALLRPTSGRIWIGDVEVTHLSERVLPELRLRQVGFVFQSFSLLSNLTATENVQVVLQTGGQSRASARARARALLDDLGLSARANSLPQQMSGGEKQRVAIARALANDPPLILADEPTANLDASSGRHAMTLLQSLARTKGKAVVAVTHDARIADLADRVLWLDDGVLTESSET